MLDLHEDILDDEIDDEIDNNEETEDETDDKGNRKTKLMMEKKRGNEENSRVIKKMQPWFRSQTMVHGLDMYMCNQNVPLGTEVKKYKQERLFTLYP